MSVKCQFLPRGCIGHTYLGYGALRATVASLFKDVAAAATRRPR
jgi:hypothetical protein